MLRGWPLLLVCTLAFGVAAALITGGRSPLYEASTMLLVTAADTTAAAQASAVTNARTLLENRGTAARVIEKLRLDQPPDSLSTVQLVSERLQIVQVRDTNYLRATLRLSSPEAARDALAMLVGESIDLNRQLGVDSIINASGGLLTKQLEEARRAMEQASSQLLAFRQKAQLERLQKDADNALNQRGRLAELDAAIASERTRVSVAEAELKGRIRRSAEPTATVNPLLENSRRNAGAPQQAPITGGGDSVYDVLDYEAAAARVRVQALRAERDVVATQMNVSRLPALYEGKRQLEQLELDHRLATNAYTELVVRLEETRRAAVSRHVNIMVADPAAASDVPVSPRVWTSAVVAAALGFSGALLALVGSLYLVPPGRRRSHA
jgi:uncharacterized protein involved in exopolysaccharide biosynthesis